MVPDKNDVLYGSLGMLVLQTLAALGPLHGYRLARRIEQISDNQLTLNQGTLYPALLKLQQMEWIVAKWGESETGRRVKIYSLTKTGRKQLERQESRWHRTTGDHRSLLQDPQRGVMSRDDRELDNEIEAHLAEAVDDYVARGLNPEEARRAALRDFGGVTQVKQVHREMRRPLFMNWLDIKLGGRMLVKYPGLTIVGGLAMAFAIMVGIVIFQFAGLFLYPSLPLPNGDRIVQLSLRDVVGESSRNRRRCTTSSRGGTRCEPIGNLGAWRDSTRTLIVADGDARPVFVAEMSSSGFAVADGQPLMGRVLTPADEQPAAPAVAVIGHDVWQTRFGSDPECARTHGAARRRTRDDRRRDARRLRLPCLARAVGAAEDRGAGSGAAFGPGDHDLRHPG